VLINLGQVLAQECGGSTKCENNANITCDDWCETRGGCDYVEFLMGYCEAYSLCSEDWYYECINGEYNYLLDCLNSPDPNCE